MTLNSAEVEELNKIITENDTIVVTHCRKKLLPFLNVKELLDSKSIGDIIFADIQILQSKENAIITKTEDHWLLKPAISSGGYFNVIAPH